MCVYLSTERAKVTEIRLSMATLTKELFGIKKSDSFLVLVHIYAPVVE